MGDGVLDELRRRGHDIVETAPWTLGRVCAVGREDGMLRAAASARGGQAYAAAR
jgi:gamma-glutamyltranspeptidase/glutathione hydrolase